MHFACLEVELQIKLSIFFPAVVVFLITSLGGDEVTPAGGVVSLELPTLVQVSKLLSLQRVSSLSPSRFIRANMRSG